VAPATTLRQAVSVFEGSGQERLPVIDPAEPARVLGLLSQQAVMAAYNAELLRQRLGGADSSVRVRAQPGV
jgi:CBS-domain-containing membrane protein